MVGSRDGSNYAQRSHITNKRGASREGLTDVVGCKRERVATNNRRGSERRRGVGLTNIPTFLAEASPITPASATNTSIHYSSAGSYCPISDHEFAESVGADVCNAVKDYFGCSITLECYTPPYEPPLSPESARSGGFLVIHFQAEGLGDVCVGLEFGGCDEGGQIFRSGFDREEWQIDPTNPLYAGVYAANFDETWRIVCQVGLMIRPRRIALSYGD